MLFSLLCYGAIVLCYKRIGIIMANWVTTTSARNQAYADAHVKPKH